MGVGGNDEGGAGQGVEGGGEIGQRGIELCQPGAARIVGRHAGGGAVTHDPQLGESGAMAAAQFAVIVRRCGAQAGRDLRKVDRQPIQ
jgi:hypothetical protein